MAIIPVSQTEANLLRALVSETLASRRYKAFAAASKAEGDEQAAVILHDLAQRRAGHAEEHLRMLDGLADTLTGRSAGDVRDNLCAAIASERERGALYAGMVRTARDEGFIEIADWFELLAKAKRSHVQRLQRALDILAEQGFIGFGK
jgi:rubrerythrin